MTLTNNPFELSTDEIPKSIYELTDRDSERSLYVAVVLQALLDLSKSIIEDETSEIKLYRDQANSWIFKDVGVTCKDFEEVCSYADLNPSLVRSFAHTVINSGDTEDVRKRFNNLL
jgi:hypothetical protein